MARGCVWVYYTKDWAPACRSSSLGSHVLKDKIWNSQARNAGACAKVEGCVRAWFSCRAVVCACGGTREDSDSLVSIPCRHQLP
jgi:hypothetical protein